MKHCLTIAGSDCSGGAGIQADLKSFSANGCYGASVITSVVAENTCRVISMYNMPVCEIEHQIDAVFEDIDIDAVKLGMLPTIDIIKSVAEKLSECKAIIICDPVMVATSGDSLSSDDTMPAMKESLFPIVDLLTPNIPEAEVISGIEIHSIEDMKRAAEIICTMGVKNVLVKGGHLTDEAVDIFYDGSNFRSLVCRRVYTKNTHGTGCTLSSAICANIANGKDMFTAVSDAKNYVTDALKYSEEIGKGHSPVNHFYNYYNILKGI